MPVLAGWTVRKHLGLSGANSRDLEAKTLQQDRHDQCCNLRRLFLRGECSSRKYPMAHASNNATTSMLQERSLCVPLWHWLLSIASSNGYQNAVGL